ncbi:hypothetical protein PENSPDRAFT_180170 [Peniophora sp. CONT]|nr:hypothetical protein PENSPDRAFT_180170 [Peniophora sp. CONT]
MDSSSSVHPANWCAKPRVERSEARGERPIMYKHRRERSCKCPSTSACSQAVAGPAARGSMALMRASGNMRKPGVPEAQTRPYATSWFARHPIYASAIAYQTRFLSAFRHSPSPYSTSNLPRHIRPCGRIIPLKLYALILSSPLPDCITTALPPSASTSNPATLSPRPASSSCHLVP